NDIIRLRRSSLNVSYKKHKPPLHMPQYLILLILKSFLSWFRTKHPANSCIVPFPVQNKTSCKSLHPSFPGSEQNILQILASFLSRLKKQPPANPCILPFLVQTTQIAKGA